MADAKAAVDAVLRQEDSRLAGTITNRASDRGGLTRFGLCAKFHPELVAAGFYDESMSADKALPIAEETYEKGYEGPLFLAQIKSQGVATALLSFAVNEGNHQAITLLQRALLVCGQVVGLDGVMGPKTVAAVNAADPAKLLDLYCDLEANFYKHLVSVRPDQQVNLAGWLNRVAQDRALKDVVVNREAEVEVA